MSQPLQIAPLGQVRAMPPSERARWERRARLLAWGGNAWHLVEFGIAIGAGIAAGSIALIGFGADSVSGRRRVPIPPTKITASVAPIDT